MAMQAQGRRSAGGNADHPFHQVNATHFLGDTVLLQPVLISRTEPRRRRRRRIPVPADL
jgi:hypothetical protein